MLAMPSALCNTSSMPSAASRSANSRCLPGFALASTTCLARLAAIAPGRSDTELPRLQGAQPADASRGQVEQCIELMASEGMPFGGALHLDERATVVHDHVHVGL